MSTIRIGINGYGNLGRGAQIAISQNPDMKLSAIFTRRDPHTLRPVLPDVPVVHVSEAEKFTGEIDVMLLCGGSATDLMAQGPDFVKLFHTVDSFDTHAKIPAYFAQMDAAATASGHACIISAGWDPGLFSLMRTYFDSMLPTGKTYTFWGKGVSQGHSDAIRRIKGVADAVQYTIPSPDAIASVRNGRMPIFSPYEQHKRECYVVAEPGADTNEITEKIVSMPDYFKGYETTVHFISKEERREKHSAMPHGGSVIRSGLSGCPTSQNAQIIDFTLTLGSNPEFTSGVLVACARALYRMTQEGAHGAKTMLDIPPAYFSPKTGEMLRKELL